MWTTTKVESSYGSSFGTRQISPGFIDNYGPQITSQIGISGFPHRTVTTSVSELHYQPYMPPKSIVEKKTTSQRVLSTIPIGAAFRPISLINPSSLERTVIQKQQQKVVSAIPQYPPSVPLTSIVSYSTHSHQPPPPLPHFQPPPTMQPYPSPTSQIPSLTSTANTSVRIPYDAKKYCYDQRDDQSYDIQRYPVEWVRSKRPRTGVSGIQKRGRFERGRKNREQQDEGRMIKVEISIPRQMLADYIQDEREMVHLPVRNQPKSYTDRPSVIRKTVIVEQLPNYGYQQTSYQQPYHNPNPYPYPQPTHNPPYPYPPHPSSPYPYTPPNRYQNPHSHHNQPDFTGFSTYGAGYGPQDQRRYDPYWNNYRMVNKMPETFAYGVGGNWNWEGRWNQEEIVRDFRVVRREYPMGIHGWY